MKQVLIERFGGPEVVSVVDAPNPEADSGEVVIRIRSVTIVLPDVHYRNDHYVWEQPLPATPGWEAVGHVEQIGPGVEGLSPGQAVYVMTLMTSPFHLGRGFAQELVAVPANAVVPLPAGIDHDAASILGYYAIALDALHQGSGPLPATILVNGAAGALASAMTQVASVSGSVVIGTVSSPEKAEHARRCGAAHTIAYRSEDVVERTLALTGGKGVNLVVDHVGGPDFPRFFQVLDTWGTILVMNAEKGKAGIDLLDPTVHAKRWPAVRYYAAHGYMYDMETLRQRCATIIEHIAAGNLRPEVAQRFPIGRVNDALAYVEEGKLGRVLLYPGG
ncbi:MAG: zinc-binding dehydrogenase [Lysobacter sp.]|nr:zinc-binding dehydrogenase [Lysobacter sp.]